MKFIFVRHGETDYNKARKSMGSGIDAPLNKTGLRQAEELASKLDNYSFDVIVSSPLRRAKQTAEMIAKRFSRPISFDKNLRERNYGSLAGRSYEEVEKETGKSIHAIDYDYRPYGGESAEDVKERLIADIEKTKQDYRGRVVLVVTHGSVIRLAHHIFSEKVPHVGNVSIHEFDL